MKKRFAGLLCLFVLVLQTAVFAHGRPSEVNEKVIRAFHDAFPMAEKVDWREKENSYVVYFTEDAVRSQIEYDLDGNFLSAVRYYQNPCLLPLHLSWQLHKKFGDKTVYGVTETTSQSKTLYYVKLEGQNDWVTVRGNADGNLKVVEKLDKLQ
ncbi:MAG: hypothetical protein ACHQD7_00415 [Chitinophagales bacterium]